MSSDSKKEWFGEWFDSPYYHILYKNRDYSEAETFINNVIHKLEMASGDKVLDIACGKGRHSIFLNKNGMNVTGIDLSVQSIEFAKQFENDKLHFANHDMRETFQESQFDFVVNLFTSFGYFSDEKDNQKAINSAIDNLKPNGKMLLDFLNPTKVINQLKKDEKKTIDGISFDIHKRVDENNFIVKTIEFNDNEIDFKFEEKVKALKQTDFITYFNNAGAKIIGTYGSYEFDKFDMDNSDRMIFIAEKK
ncbi:SAM-dependent methyltransferase [Aureibacter tunicatorum]|uniref:SAM-dependent methyltransferase n=1 Tax=Aureibacter tunicatorum TaxID=866807 RepID=A0AAE3XKR3_9BACT|nr:class I SAM-dependent methyltransferase [Aureibacter tunicatorum]MDR6238682.1 SAM-dependent methyltransferase [Aureibacter tunicatorum]BDD05387.1 methyltransferase [Aureibacter tunicatorum]